MLIDSFLPKFSVFMMLRRREQGGGGKGKKEKGKSISQVFILSHLKVIIPIKA